MDTTTKPAGRPGHGSLCFAAVLAVLLPVTPVGLASAQESLGGVASQVSRQPANFTLGAAVERTDNVNRTPTGELSDTIYSIVSGFGWRSQNSPRMNASLTGGLSYFRYAHSRFQPDLVGSALGTFDYELVQNVLTWHMQDSLRQARINEVDPITPNNRQNANLFTAGPRLRLGLWDSQTNLLAEAQYERSDYEKSPDDSQAWTARLTLSRMLGPRSTIGVGAVRRKIQHAGSSLFPDYVSQDYIATWNATGAKTQLELIGGYSFADQPGNNADSPYLQLALTRRVGARGAVELYLAKRLTGSSDAIHFDPTIAVSGPKTSEFAVNPDPFKLSSAGLTYTLADTKYSIEIGGSLQRARYVSTVVDDRNVKQIRTDAWVMPTMRWTMGTFGSYSVERFINRGNAESKLFDYGVFTGFLLTARMRAEATWQHTQRKANFAAAEYAESSARIALTYTWGQAGYSSGVSSPRTYR